MLRILHLDKNPKEVARLRQFMTEHVCPHLDYVEVMDAERYRDAVADGRYDLILGNNNIPGLSAATMLQLAREHCPDAPFVFLSDRLCSTDVLDGVRLGADDVIDTNDLQRLLPVVRRSRMRR